jgi:CHRD domain
LTIFGGVGVIFGRGKKTMRSFLVLTACFATLNVNAQIWEFDLGPAIGPFGLNGANERPLPTASPATGGEIKDHDSNNYINYNTVTKALELHFGWGSDPALDFGGTPGTDLTADLSGLHIHGPADVNNSTGVLYNLLTLAGSATDPGEGFYNPNGDGRSGAIDLTVQLVDGIGGYSIAQQEAQLLGNNWYINIHSAGPYSGGEIRGQLLYVIPEPEHYAALAGLALLGFAGYRRFKKSEQPA